MPGDIVVSPCRKFVIEGVPAMTERRVGKFIAWHGEVAMIYCPDGGFTWIPRKRAHRATSAQERTFRRRWDGMLAALRRGPR